MRVLAALVVAGALAGSSALPLASTPPGALIARSESAVDAMGDFRKMLDALVASKQRNVPPTQQEIDALIANELRITGAEIKASVEAVRDNLAAQMQDNVDVLQAGYDFEMAHYTMGTDASKDKKLQRIANNIQKLRARIERSKGLQATVKPKAKLVTTTTTVTSTTHTTIANQDASGSESAVASPGPASGGAPAPVAAASGSAAAGSAQSGGAPAVTPAPAVVGSAAKSGSAPAVTPAPVAAAAAGQ